MSFATNTYTSKILFIVAAFCGSAAVLLISERMETFKKIKWVCALGRNTMGIVIWQFVAFKLVSLVQIVVYNLPMGKLTDYPVIYEYATIPWILADTVVGIAGSIVIYKILSKIANHIALARK